MKFFQYEETVTQQRHAFTQYQCIRQAETVERATERTQEYATGSVALLTVADLGAMLTWSSQKVPSKKRRRITKGKSNYTLLIGFLASQQINSVTVHREMIQQYLTTNTQSLTLDQVIEQFGDVFIGTRLHGRNLYLTIDNHNGKKSPDKPSRVLFALKDKDEVRTRTARTTSNASQGKTSLHSGCQMLQLLKSSTEN